MSSLFVREVTNDCVMNSSSRVRSIVRDITSRLQPRQTVRECHVDVLTAVSSHTVGRKSSASCFLSGVGYAHTRMANHLFVFRQFDCTKRSPRTITDRLSK